MGLYDESLGVLLLGIIINTYFFGFVTYQYMSYFNRGYKDSLWVKATVALLCLNDTVYSASLIYMAWLYCVQHYGDPTILTSVPWPSSYTPVANAISSILTHQFLTARTSRLMESKMVYVGIMTLSMGNFVVAIVAAVKSWMAKNIYDQQTLKEYLIAWLSLQAAVDIIVAGTLSYALYRARTGYHRTDNVIYRLIRGAVQTGLFACIFAIGHLTAFLVSPDTQVYAFFAGSTGRMYSITLMDTLHSRDQLRDALSGTMDVNSSIIRTHNGHSSSDYPRIFQLSTVNTRQDVLSEGGPGRTNTKLVPGQDSSGTLDTDRSGEYLS
ncbi:uncharacterized protein EV420DRAFT_1571621 [Desarmillaria tabescens]|uniref:DUF6534 domain-containing protein n=1 Tax=Armillaria tabescens TaxID=1929756 RepID=A0AA39JNL6_ARMTA|nr:uncharacterized protein EV420DRAFT_1571621 [Desarmillaria tabescens]KAK0446076.1 hypothetical protein EV420DRAFT_1571621 [Desarmillaria tabescens]